MHQITLYSSRHAKFIENQVYPYTHAESNIRNAAERTQLAASALYLIFMRCAFVTASNEPPNQPIYFSGILLYQPIWAVYVYEVVRTRPHTEKEHPELL